MASPSVPKNSSIVQLDLNRSPEYNENISLLDISGCDRVKSSFKEPLFEEPASLESGIYSNNFI